MDVEKSRKVRNRGPRLGHWVMPASADSEQEERE